MPVAWLPRPQLELPTNFRKSSAKIYVELCLVPFPPRVPIFLYWHELLAEPGFETTALN